MSSQSPRRSVALLVATLVAVSGASGAFATVLFGPSGGWDFDLDFGAYQGDSGTSNDQGSQSSGQSGPQSGGTSGQTGGTGPTAGGTSSQTGSDSGSQEICYNEDHKPCPSGKEPKPVGDELDVCDGVDAQGQQYKGIRATCEDEGSDVTCRQDDGSQLGDNEERICNNQGCLICSQNTSNNSGDSSNNDGSSDDSEGGEGDGCDEGLPEAEFYECAYGSKCLNGKVEWPPEECEPGVGEIGYYCDNECTITLSEYSTCIMCSGYTPQQTLEGQYFCPRPCSAYGYDTNGDKQADKYECGRPSFGQTDCREYLDPVPDALLNLQFFSSDGTTKVSACGGTSMLFADGETVSVDTESHVIPDPRDPSANYVKGIQLTNGGVAYVARGARALEKPRFIVRSASGQESEPLARAYSLADSITILGMSDAGLLLHLNYNSQASGQGKAVFVVLNADMTTTTAVAKAVGFSVTYKGGIGNKGNIVLQQGYPGYGAGLLGITADKKQGGSCL